MTIYWSCAGGDYFYSDASMTGRVQENAEVISMPEVDFKIYEINKFY